MAAPSARTHGASASWPACDVGRTRRVFSWTGGVTWTLMLLAVGRFSRKSIGLLLDRQARGRSWTREASDQMLESRLGSQRIQPGVDGEPEHRRVAGCNSCG